MGNIIFSLKRENFTVPRDVVINEVPLTKLYVLEGRQSSLATVMVGLKQAQLHVISAGMVVPEFELCFYRQSSHQGQWTQADKDDAAKAFAADIERVYQREALNLESYNKNVNCSYRLQVFQRGVAQIQGNLLTMRVGFAIESMLANIYDGDIETKFEIRDAEDNPIAKEIWDVSHPEGSSNHFPFLRIDSKGAAEDFHEEMAEICHAALTKRYCKG